MVLDFSFLKGFFLVIVILILLSFNLYNGIISDFPITITILECSEFNYMFTFTSEFYTFIYFHVTNQCPLVSALRTLFNISCKAGLVVINSFSFCLSGKLFLSPSVLFFLFWLCWVFVAVHGIPLVAVRGGHSSLQCAGFSMSWLLLLWSTGSRRAGFSSCGTWAQQLWLAVSRAQAQQLWHMGPVAPWHVGSSRARA